MGLYSWLSSLGHCQVSSCSSINHMVFVSCVVVHRCGWLWLVSSTEQQSCWRQGQSSVKLSVVGDHWEYIRGGVLLWSVLCRPLVVAVVLRWSLGRVAAHSARSRQASRGVDSAIYGMEVMCHGRNLGAIVILRESSSFTGIRSFQGRRGYCIGLCY